MLQFIVMIVLSVCAYGICVRGRQEARGSFLRSSGGRAESVARVFEIDWKLCAFRLFFSSPRVGGLLSRAAGDIRLANLRDRGSFWEIISLERSFYRGRRGESPSISGVGIHGVERERSRVDRENGIDRCQDAKNRRRHETIGIVPGVRSFEAIAYWITMNLFDFLHENFRWPDSFRIGRVK